MLGMNRDWQNCENDEQCESKSEQHQFRIHDGNRIKTAAAPGQSGYRTTEPGTHLYV